MPKPNENGESPKGEEPKEGEITAEAFNSLKEQVENLNKGIASYRDKYQSTETKLTEVLELNKELKDKLGGAVDDEVSLSDSDQKKLEQWAKKQGFVTAEKLQEKETEMKQQNYKQIESQAVNEFIEKYPEYDDDDNWNAVKEQFQMYRQPSSLAGYKKILEKIRKDLSGGDVDKAKEEGEVKTRAKLKSKGRLTLGGGKKGSTGNESQLEQLREQYPNLSEGEIKQRLFEIDELYPEED